VNRLWLVLALAGCNSDPIDRDIDNEVTIENGIYGQLSVAENHFGQSAGVLENVRVTTYTSDSPPMVDENTTTDARGFYQIDTGPGAFAMCAASGSPAQGTSNPGPCTSIDIPDSGNVRRDWVQNLDGGHWCNSACSEEDNQP
jgi:hypothetical protein